VAKTKKPARRGRPRLIGAAAPEKMLGIRASKGLIERLDSWRKVQGDKPTQSEAVRRLIEIALSAAGH
jgi:hypothetical protein